MSSVGLLPVYELRLRMLEMGPWVRSRVMLTSEVRRLRRAMDRPKPSASVLVVIPTYKRPEQLADALRSVLAQTYEDLVVLVVDDGGSGLPDLPPHPRVHAVSLSRNTGIAGFVRNVGISLADSDYIAYLDDDNTWTPDHLAAAVAALEADRTLAAVYTAVRRLWPDGSELDILGKPFSRPSMKNTNYIDTNSLVVRRSRNVPFSVLPRHRDAIPREDWEYVWRLTRRRWRLSRPKMTYIPTPTILYAVNPDSYFSTWE